MNYLFIGTNNKNAYGGGRYHAWLMAQALVSNGHEVTFWTNNIPIFYRDFEKSEYQRRIYIDLSLSYKMFKTGNYDWIIMVPDMVPKSPIYGKALLTSKLCNSKITLVNFESPNWYNSLSSKKRAEGLWDGWRMIGKHASLILSSTNEGNKFARKYYKTNASFDYCYPSINSTVEITESNLKTNEILLITRFDKNSKHKGTQYLFKLFDDRLKGSTISIISGMKLDKSVQDELNKLSINSGVELKIYKKVTDAKKFEIISRASILLFLTEFEGFGYPPIEALCVGTLSLVSPLPVLIETCGENVCYFNYDKDIVEQILEIKDNAIISKDVSKNFRKKFSILQFGVELQKVFDKDVTSNELEIKPLLLFTKICYSYFGFIIFKWKEYKMK